MTQFIRTTINLTPNLHKKVLAYGKRYGMNSFGEASRDIVRRYLEGKSLAQAARRTHNTIDLLPAEIRTAVERMIKGEWPEDYGPHYDGTPRYLDCVLYCNKKGHTVSESAIGRFAIKIRGPLR